MIILLEGGTLAKILSRQNSTDDSIVVFYFVMSCDYAAKLSDYRNKGICGTAEVRVYSKTKKSSR